MHNEHGNTCKYIYKDMDIYARIAVFSTLENKIELTRILGFKFDN